MTDDADKPISRYQRWRMANPEKARAQQERKRLRTKGLLPPYERPPTPDRREERRVYMRDWHKRRQERLISDPEFAEKTRKQSRLRARAYWERLKADPVAHAAYLEKKKMDARSKIRVRIGLPLDAPPLRAPAKTAMPIEERRKRNAEAKRRAYRRERGLPLDAPKGLPKPKKPKPKAIDQERARRAAEVEVAKVAQSVNPAAPPPPCPDPPALQELFRKASKGEPPRPFPAAGRKRSVFWLRGMY